VGGSTVDEVGAWERHHGRRSPRVQQEGARVELDAGAAQRRQLPGAEQVRGAAPLDPDQLEEVDLPLVGRALEPPDLGGTEL